MQRSSTTSPAMAHRLRTSSSEVIAVSTHAFDLGSALREPGVSCSTLTVGR
ncbi:hypothetical protein CPAR01_11771 [Colletotrichum paranaense]|uniref:Uncharacterized protein n=1 Tax=Colletotrichum paranaense TaxID=1914294 RepID=A0ABQ9S843_9PEZI|nr:uncharacterized protein CPAR01_11771 [Colletotrichum paranaense]KAK1529459.1 hypothetical protein CPAR01_11771 [Colletotrichum paranaense]